MICDCSQQIMLSVYGLAEAVFLKWHILGKKYYVSWMFSIEVQHQQESMQGVDMWLLSEFNCKKLNQVCPCVTWRSCTVADSIK